MAKVVKIAGWHREQNEDGEWSTDLDITCGDGMQAAMCVWEAGGKWKANADILNGKAFTS